MIKKPEEYALQYENTVYSIADVIRQAQLDMLKEAVKRCAENAEVKVYSKDGRIYPTLNVDEQSILKTIDEIKSEII